MTQTAWSKRIARASSLLQRYPFASELLNFYVKLAELQDQLYEKFPRRTHLSFAQPIGSQADSMRDAFISFLSNIEKVGTRQLADVASSLKSLDAEAMAHFLDQCWTNDAMRDDPSFFLARAFLQPYAAFAREQMPAPEEKLAYVCPYCRSKPCAGALRQQSEGSRRSLICSFCNAEWDFRRIACAGCGEDNDQKLPVFESSQFELIRVECCETCKQYLKTINLAKNGHAEPIVDEIASAPLDLWAREHGYQKLELNLLGM